VQNIRWFIPFFQAGSWTLDAQANDACRAFILSVFWSIICGLSFGLMFTSTSAASTTCEAVDLRGPALGATRDQGAVGWCYAFSAADLLSYHTGERVSAGALAVNYEGHTPRTGGYVQEVLDQAQRNGFCRLEQFNVEGRATDTGFFTTERMLHILNREIGNDLESHATPILEHIRLRERIARNEAEDQQLKERERTQYFWQRWLDLETAPTRERIRSQMADYTRRLRELEEQRCQNRLLEQPDLDRITPLLSLLDRMEISSEYIRRESLSPNSEMNLPYLVAQRACRPLRPVQPQARIVNTRKGVRRPVVPTPRPRATPESQTPTVITTGATPARRGTPPLPATSGDHLDQTLSAGRPLAINYNVNAILSEGSPRYPSMHSSTIVGRRMNAQTGKCEYLVRNSWGEECEVEGRPRYRYECEQGNIWVPRDTVMNMHTEFISLDP
jgi:hypothetical protein